MDIYEIRRANLQRLVDDRFGGNKSALAHEVGKQASYISRCLITDPDNPHRKKIGETLAREIEDELVLDHRALDELPSKPEGAGVSEQSNHSQEGFMTDRSNAALRHLEAAVRDGRLSESDLLLLEQIANRIAARPAPAENTQNNPHERLKDKLGNNDSSTER